MLRLALIGAGRTVVMGHAPALQALHDRYQVVAVADASPEALEHIGVLLAVPPERRYLDYREMLLREEVDVVDIALPHAFHHEAARSALYAGAHLITERPLALSIRDAEELLRVAEMRGKQISVLHFYLYFPPFREAIRQVRDGAIGEPFFIRCEGVTGGFGPGTAAYHPEWHGNPEIAGGGVWIDSGYHSIYLCNTLMESLIVSVAAQVGTYAQDIQVEDTAAALLTHTNSGISSIQVAWSVPAGGERVFEIYGKAGSIALGHDGHPLGIFSNETQSWRHPEVRFGQADSFIGIFEAIADCLESGALPPVSHRDALHTLEVVVAGYRASEKGTVETIVL
ncbi:MAG: Gfo/Idh/MocA family protein [Armatimonadota bacterium]